MVLHARIFPLVANEPEFTKEHGPACFLRRYESSRRCETMTNHLAGQVSMFDLASPFGRTCPEHIQATKDATSKPSCKLSAKSQIPTFMFLSLRGGSGRRQDASWEKATALPGVRWTPNISQGLHSEENASTLSQILVPNAPERYYLSRTACEGILRRAAKRGKELPKMLNDALEEAVALNA